MFQRLVMAVVGQRHHTEVCDVDDYVMMAAGTCPWTVTSWEQLFGIGVATGCTGCTCTAGAEKKVGA